MVRGRKPKLSNAGERFLLDMAKYVTSLSSLRDCVKKGCGITLTIPTVANYLKRNLGKKGYEKLKKDWRLAKEKGKVFSVE